MSSILIPDSNAGFIPSGLFQGNANRTLQGINAWWINADTAQTVVMDAVTLTVIDGDGDTQYILTDATTPAIELEEPANVYVVESIDVTGFVDGDITLTWSGESDGYIYSIVDTVEYNPTKDAVFVTGLTNTLESFDAIIGEPKTFTVKAVDSIHNPISSGTVQLVIWDRKNATETEAATTTLQGSGTGLYLVNHTFAAATYSPDLNRYEVYFRIQLEDGGNWYEIEGSRHRLEIYGASTDVTVGVLTYSTNTDMRKTFPGIDMFLSDIVTNQGEREILINNKRKQVADVISLQVKNTRVRANREILKQWEIYETYRQILISAHGFGKFQVSDSQLKEIDNHIKRLKITLFGTISTIRIGPRA